MWYLPALIVAVICCYFSIKLFKTKGAVIISAVLYGCGYLMSTWYGTVSSNIFVQLYFKIFKTAENGLLYGFLFVAIGAVISCETKHKEKSIIFSIVGFVVSFILMIFEAVIIQTNPMSYGGSFELITVPIASFFLFKLIMAIKLEDKKIFIIMRNMSVLIYLSHCWIIRFLKMIYAIMNINTNSVVLFFETLALSILFSVFVISFSKKYKFFRFLF